MLTINKRYRVVTADQLNFRGRILTLDDKFLSLLDERDHREVIIAIGNIARAEALDDT